jgi:hypothetical protein
MGHAICSTIWRSVFVEHEPVGTHYIENGTDPTGLGRWTSTQYRGKGQVRLRFISAYCPNKNEQGAATVWTQQKTYFEEKLSGIDPIEAFYRDLTAAVQQWLKEGDQVVLMLDLNDDIRTSPFTAMLEAIGMTELMGFRHGNATMPRTFQSGSRPIDGLFVSSTLVGCSCGYLPFGDFDHRPMWIDIPYSIAFGHVVPPLAYRQPDRLNYQDPRCVAAYHKHYKAAEKKKRLFEKGKLIRRDGPGQYTSFEAEQWEKNERERQEVRNYAKKRCRKLRMGRKDFSPKRKELIKKKEFWELQVRLFSGKRVRNRHLKRVQHQADWTMSLSNLWMRH